MATHASILSWRISMGRGAWWPAGPPCPHGLLGLQPLPGLTSNPGVVHSQPSDQTHLIRTPLSPTPLLPSTAQSDVVS